MWPSRALTLLEMKISCQTTFLNHRPPSPTSGRDPRRAEPPEGECATPAQQRLTFPQATMERATWYQRWNSPKANFMARSRHCGEGDSQYFPTRVLSPPGHPYLPLPKSLPVGGCRRLVLGSCQKIPGLTCLCLRQAIRPCASISPSLALDSHLHNT